MAKIGGNERCPCGSGKEYERCCGDRGAPPMYTAEDRAGAYDRLRGWIIAFADEEAEAAAAGLWGEFYGRDRELPVELAMCAVDVEEAWFAFDDVGDRSVTIADVLLAEPSLSEGERAFLTAMRASTMRLYEIVAVAPGASLTLRDVIEGGQITVNERTASRTIGRHEHLAARIVLRGPSGGPEMEGVALYIPRMHQASLVEQLRAQRTRFLEAHPGASVDAFYKEAPPRFFQAWVSAILGPRVPELKSTDEASLVPTTPRFEVLDAEALDEGPELERAGEGEGEGESEDEDEGEGEDEDEDEDEDESADAGDGEGEDEDESELAEPLVLGYYATHYRQWLDEPSPALRGATPRRAAADPALRERVVELVQGLLAQYQSALRHREPAYDPSWMWAELGLEDREAVRHPPPLVSAGGAQAVPGSGALAREVAELVRRAPGFDNSRTVLTPEAEAVDLELQRFVRTGGAAAAPYLRPMIDFELHRRKTFWIDAPLAYLLDQTELDVMGRELRLPFGAFALVFTDRHVLSLAERLLASQAYCPQAGQLLQVATVHVEEHRRRDARSLELCFAFDALGASLPALVRHELPLADLGRVQAHLDATAPLPPIEPSPPDTSPLRGLVRTAINAILYATSASITLEHLAPPSPAASRGRAAPPAFSSEAIYFLPGTIDITRLRKLQELERAPDGRALLRRHLVRGHWRRSQQGWPEQRLRWIEPHWKGPDLEAVIERAYRLKA